MMPLGSMIRPEPLTAVTCSAPSASALFDAPAEGVPVEAGALTNAVMLTTVGSRPRITSVWPGAIICICCAPACLGVSNRTPAPRMRPDNVGNQLRYRIEAPSVGDVVGDHVPPAVPATDTTLRREVASRNSARVIGVRGVGARVAGVRGVGVRGVGVSVPDL